MMTTLEAIAKATAIVLHKGSGKWAKAESDDAAKLCTDWFKAGQMEATTFAESLGRLTGNHSQRRQFLEKSGLIASTESDSAEKRAILDAMKALDAASDKAIESLGKK